MLPVRGYHAAPFVVPFANPGVPSLQGTPRCIFSWLNAYTAAKCLKTSSSGVNEGELKVENTKREKITNK